MVAKAFPRYAPLDPLPEADMDDRATWLEYVIPGAAGEIIIGTGLGAVPGRIQGDSRWLPLTGGTISANLTVTGVSTQNGVTDMNNTTTVDVTNPAAFSVRDATNVNTFVTDTTNKEIEGRNGAKFRGFSDDGTTERWSIDSATGNAQFDGTLTVDAASDFNGAQTVDITSATAMAVRDTSNVNTLVVNTSAKEIHGRNGAKFRGFSDDGTTERFSLDAATGNVQADGTLAADGAITCTALVNKSANYTATATDQVITCDATSAAFTITLPAVASLPIGKTYTVKKTDATNNIVIVDANASETIDGLLVFHLTGQYTEVELISTGAAWRVSNAIIGLSPYIHTVRADASTSSVALTNATAYITKVEVYAPITVTKLTIIVGTSSGNADAAIYRNNGTVLTRLVSAGTTVLTASSAAQTLTVAATTLYPGYDYAFAYAQDNSVATIGRSAVSGPTSFVAGRVRALTGGGFPLPSSITIASTVASGTNVAITGEP